jgi:AcrR family transcriptional regulator
MTDEPPSDEGGRPADRGQARRQAFLEAAREVFLENGFEDASVNEVVRRAGGSLATLYAQFGNKDGLFLAVCQYQHDRFIGGMVPARDDSLPLEQGLQAIGEQFLAALLERNSLAFFRIAIGGARRHPELMQRYVLTGAERVRAVVAGYLLARAETEGRKLDDADLAASFFFDLLRSKHHYAALAFEDYKLSAEALTAHVRASVRFFIGGAFAP